LKPGRNDPCPCGSGKKYKQCCLLKEAGPPKPTPTPKAANPSQDQLNQLVELFNGGRHAEMEAVSRALTQQFPNSGQAWKAFGTALHMLGKDASPALQRAAQFLQDDPEAHNNLAAALLNSGRALDAAGAAQHALSLRPGYAEAHANLGRALLQLKRLPESIANYEHAIMLWPHDPSWHCNLGIAYSQSGRLDEAKLAFETTLKLEPSVVAAHYGLSQLKTYAPDDSHCAALESRIQDAGALPPDLRLLFWFALGKMREDQGRYDDAFAAYREGNRLKHDTIRADEDLADRVVERIIATFNGDLLATRSGQGYAAAGKTPVFIVGMPRSGTSLLEQILASCEGIHGAGELRLISDISEEAFRGPKPFPLAVPDLSPEKLADMGRQYMERAWRLAPEAARLTDKMPENFFYLGLIRLMLPQAKIIHIMRDPMDTCFSCYALLFDGDKQAFSYDMGMLGRYYGRYARLMAHWHAVLGDAVLPLRYEDLVQDTETQAKRVLDYLGLPWDARCLDFHRNPRRVDTASAAQVRKPIYTSSMKRWQRFAQHLEPLSQLIRQAGGPI
jgi:tetratricopeptide (TPR) repeat protein